MRRLAALLAIGLGVLMIAPPTAASQVAVAEGHRVRVLVRDQPSPVEGVLVSLSSATWIISTPAAGERTLPTGSILSSEVAVRKRNALRGAGIGGGSFLLVGLIMAYGFDDSCTDDPLEQVFCDLVDDAFNIAALVYLPIIGAGGGALVGSVIKTERWVPAVVPSTMLGGRGLSIRWKVQMPR